MKSKVFKISVVLSIILTMIMANFIFVGNTLISYALDSNNSTNNTNVGFNTYLKNENGEKVSSLDMVASNLETTLYFYLSVKQEGYFNGTINLEDGANFQLVETDSQYVEKVEANTIKLCNITAGASIEIPVKVKLLKEETFNVGFLDVESKITINGIYRDSSEKDKEIKATKTVKIKLVDEVTQEDIRNEVNIITNKILNVDGEEKRVVQLSWNIGLKNNNYPIQEIIAKIEAPTLGESVPQVEKQVTLNTMTSYDYNKENSIDEITLKNEKTQEGNIVWKTSGAENILLTYIYDKEVDMNHISFQPEVKMTLYNQKEITSISQIVSNEEEKDSILEVTSENQENEIYKGKLVAGMERPYITRTSVKVNLAKAIDEIKIQEKASTYTIHEAENPANIVYAKTVIKKEQFDSILGENGVITIANQENQILATIDTNSVADENGYLVVDYSESETRELKIQTTKPVAEGILQFNHIKNIKESKKDTIKSAFRIYHTISYQYNQGEEKQVENSIHLKDTVTESKITVDKNQLSTVVENDVEIRLTLLANNEKYDLYQNPNFTVTLPDQVENIEITNISKLYDDNNEFKNPEYSIDGKSIRISLLGKQTNYTTAVEGITIVIKAKIQVNKTAATSDEQIMMTYENENGVSYANNAIASMPIRIVAPRDITTVNRIEELSVETIGEEEKTDVIMEKGANEKQLEAQIEIINSSQSAINEVKILGDFPTNNSENNMGITITEGIQVTGVDDAKVYYSTNEKATEDITDEQNGWSENLDASETKKYLILSNMVDAQSSVQATYNMTVPENLEYNLIAEESYTIMAVNSENETTSKLTSTRIAMQTGVGPKIESKLQAVVGADRLEENATVKNGEVIKYQIEVANTGSEDVADVTVTGKVPEGTKLVEPMEDYEYTGATYYEEIDQTSYETTIKSLKAGETTTVEYEVRLNSDLKAGTVLTNETEVKYGEVKITNTLTNVTETSNLRVSLKRITDRRTQIYVGDYILYYVMVENISDVEQKDVIIQTNLSNNVEVYKLKLLTEEGTSTSPGEDYEEKNVIAYQPEVNIGNIASGETKLLCYSLKTKYVQENTETVTISVRAKSGGQECRSNQWEDKLLRYDIKASMTTNTETQFVEIGNEIEYTITLENIETADTRDIEVIDEIPIDLEIKSITLNGEERNIPTNSNKVVISTNVEAQSTTTIKIKTVVDYHENLEAKSITNQATVVEGEEVVATTEELTHIIKGIQLETGGNDDGKDDGDDNPNNGDDTPGNIQGKQMIAGIAWLDRNENGKKDTGDSLLSNIRVKLLNTETNKIVAETATRENGVYILENVANGKYIVIFEYDTTKYGLTTYQASESSESENSNAVMNELNIDGTITQVASTDIITINDSNVSNMNIGLVELKSFDLRLDKYVSQVLIQDRTGTTIKQYDNANMAKAELDAKKVNGSTVLIEYNIIVSNVGEVEGYVKKIVDYMPSDLKFSSELNKDWYQANGALYNTSLANEKIVAGESRTITLTLTKSMTENNVGLINNTAEIAEDYNALGLQDSNSTPGNKVKGENDMSSAEVILSIRTGGIVYVSIAIIIIAIIGGIVTFVIIRRKKIIEERR